MPFTVRIATYYGSTRQGMRLVCDRCGTPLLSADEWPLDDLVEIAGGHRCPDWRPVDVS